MSEHGQMYYEGKELEVRHKDARPGHLSEALRNALGMPHENSPPPWLVNMQRFGPPPCYPYLKVPGVNCPIPGNFVRLYFSSFMCLETSHAACRGSPFCLVRCAFVVRAQRVHDGALERVNGVKLRSMHLVDRCTVTCMDVNEKRMYVLSLPISIRRLLLRVLMYAD
jgi:hypothetical protein